MNKRPFLLLWLALLGGSGLVGAQQPTPHQTLPPLSSWLDTPTPAPSMPGGISPLATAKSNVTYNLNRKPDPDPGEQAAYDKITRTMDEAVRYYNQHSAGLTKVLQVSYDPGVPTADGNSNGSVRFGRDTVSVVATAMHEIAHTMGVGTSGQWGKLNQKGVFTGPHATAVLREIDHDPKAVVHCDNQHFWPYGLNYAGEVKSNQDYVNHCKMVTAIAQDLREVR